MKQQWSPQELDRFWLLSEEQLTLFGKVQRKNRLAFAAQLKFLENEGRFPRHRGELPKALVGFISNQLGVSTSMHQHDWHGRTAERHRAEIRVGDCIRLRATCRRARSGLEWSDPGG